MTLIDKEIDGPYQTSIKLLKNFITKLKITSTIANTAGQRISL